jgi:hypothetical protein
LILELPVTESYKRLPVLELYDSISVDLISNHSGGVKIFVDFFLLLFYENECAIDKAL